MSYCRESELLDQLEDCEERMGLADCREALDYLEAEYQELQEELEREIMNREGMYR